MASLEGLKKVRDVIATSIHRVESANPEEPVGHLSQMEIDVRRRLLERIETDIRKFEKR